MANSFHDDRTTRKPSPPLSPSSRSSKKRTTSTRGWILLLVGFALGFAAASILSSVLPTQNTSLSSPHFQDMVPTPQTQPKVKKAIEAVEIKDIEPVDEIKAIEPVEIKAIKPVEIKNYKPVDEIKDFDPDAPVVIVTKIQNKNTVGALNQSLCLLNYAYNHRVNYDVVVFTATEISEKQRIMIQSTVYPAKFTLVMDNPGIQAMVDELDETRKQHLLQRCNVTDAKDLDWTTRCVETTSAGDIVMPIAYNWQAEFRSLHLWNHPALKKYKYMLWMDTDGFCTKVWKQDPIAIMRRSNAVLLFNNFPKGAAKGTEWPPIIKESFGETYCSVDVTGDGHLEAKRGDCMGKSVHIKQIHGYFHLTDLDFYRSEPVMKWLRTMIGDTKFSRMFDDQIAVTMPAAVLAGNRSWDLRSVGAHLGVSHDFLLDGRVKEPIGGFIKFWKASANVTFPEAYGKCNIISPG